VREYGAWSTADGVATLLTRVSCACVRAAGQSCADELVATETLHVLCRNVTTGAGGFALKVSAVPLCVAVFTPAVMRQLPLL
jgi:hypothetical protein